MAGYQPYPEYKDSGVEWLGEVPRHWNTVRLKHLAFIRNGKDYKDVVADEGYPVIGSGGEFAVASEYLYEGESVLLGRKGTIDRPLYIDGAFWTVDTMFYTEVNPSVSAKYLYYCALTINFGRYVTSTALPSMTQQDLGNIQFAAPVLEEQQTIARFLDHKTAQIDALIAKKQTLLEKLTEKRTALISHAVTKGLDPNVKMKDSGVEWLGQVPEHWEVIPIKFALEIPITDGPHSTPQFYDDGIPFLSAEAVKNDELDFDKKRGYISEEDHATFSLKYKPRFGDVYMVKSGATTGNVARVKTHDEFNIWSPLAVLRPKRDCSTTDYIFYILKSRSFFCSVELSWSFGTQQNIGMGVISNIRIAHPPYHEQIKICNHITPLLEAITKQHQKVCAAISKLQEYRSALITQAVTGKIDVRNVKIPEATTKGQAA